jgi:hypothetical protein
MKKSITTVQKHLLSTLLVLFISIQGYAQTNLAVWNPNGVTGYGSSSWNATSKAANINTAVLRRGSGVGTGGSAAGSAWGGNDFSATSVANAVSSNRFVSFEVSANENYLMSLNTIALRYRRSGSGPAAGELYYAIDNGTFSKITNLTFSSTSSSGADHASISLASYEALQNIPANTKVTFRIIPLNGGSGGTWYIFGSGLVLNGKVEAAPIPANPTLAASSTTLSDFGRVCLSATSTEQSFTLTGSDLSAGDIQVKKLDGYLFSTTQEGPYYDSLILTQNGGNYSQDIFVQFAPTSRQVYAANIVVAAAEVTDLLIATTGTGTGPAATIQKSQDNFCAGDSTVLTTLASDGQAPYTYLWTVSDQSLSDVNISNPTAHPASSTTYEVIVTDDELCTTYAEVTISVNPSIRKITATAQDITCYGETNGSISLQVESDATVLSFAWSGPNNFSAVTENLTDLAQGSYKVIVSTDQQCADSALVTIAEPSQMTATIDSLQHPSCPSCADGYLSLEVLGGTAPYTIVWDNMHTENENKDLPEGQYCATITDAHGCSTSVCEQITGITTGITTLAGQKNASSIYPNPSTGGTVYIALATTTANAATYEVIFYDLAGKVVYTSTLSTTERILVVNPVLTNGMYLYQLKAEGSLLGSGYLQIAR